MEKRQRTYTGDSTIAPSQEAIAALDPLLQPFDDDGDALKDSPYYARHRTSIFYIPNPTIDDEVFEKCNRRFYRTLISYLRRFEGILYSLLASLLFTSSNFIIKQLDVVLLDVFLVRFIFQGLISLGFILYKGYPIFTDAQSILFLIRSFIAALGSICFYLGLSLLPLPDLTTLRYTQVIWTALIAMMIYRERINLPTIIACILTLMGVVCVAQPSFLFPHAKSLNYTSHSTFIKTENPRLLGMLIALTCALSISAAIVLNKKLLEKNVRQSIIMFYFILTTLFFLVFLQTYYWIFIPENYQRFYPMKIYFRRDFIYATILATLQLIPMVLSQKSVKREHPSIVTVIQASDILFAIIFQTLFSTKKSNGLALIGSMLVLFSIVLVGAHKLYQDRRNRTCVPNEEN